MAVEASGAAATVTIRQSCEGRCSGGRGRAGGAVEGEGVNEGFVWWYWCWCCYDIATCLILVRRNCFHCLTMESTAVNAYTDSVSAVAAVVSIVRQWNQSSPPPTPVSTPLAVSAGASAAPPVDALPVTQAAALLSIFPCFRRFFRKFE